MYNFKKCLLAICRFCPKCSDDIHFYPEEMYIIPPLGEYVKTGSIVKNDDSPNYQIVLSPACDLVLRDDGMPKTDSILICKIENIKDLALNKDKRKRILKNNYTTYYHYLPKTNLFLGGVINFRKIEAISITNFKERFDQVIAQTTMSFTKDIVARFSSYYSRQGQPDFDIDMLLAELEKE